MKRLLWPIVFAVLIALGIAFAAWWFFLRKVTKTQVTHTVDLVEEEVSVRWKEPDAP